MARVEASVEAGMKGGIAHGGRLIEARRLFPDAPEPWVDLSTGINPHPYPIGPMGADLFTRLPEPEALGRLQEIAARAYGAGDPASVMAAPGTQILISLLPHLMRLEQATILGPTYAEHEAAWAAAGRRVGIARDPASFAAMGEQGGGAAILCNPNNPDGRRCEPAMLLQLADALARRGGMLVVDEAFADLEQPDPGLARFLPHPALLILRSFGKTYGLAGLRLGFLLASPETAGRVRAALGPWAVSGPALAAGCAALADAGWRSEAGSRLEQDCRRLDALLVRAGFEQAGGTRLFRLFRGLHADAVFRSLGEAGILTRRFARHPDLLRFGLPGGEADWARLEAALAG
jgi:cobalamin biosynthesis protein CobC